MGRTKRIRCRKSKEHLSTSLESNTSVINLKAWMSSRGWRNENNLQLREFPETGRGVASKKSIFKNDLLIIIPFHILITYETVLHSGLIDLLTECQLTIHDYLSLFLIMEKHRGKQSIWKDYINSLPSLAPDLPWQSSLAEIELFTEEMREVSLKLRSDFITSWSRVKQSISRFRTCVDCKEPLDCVISEDIFIWAYVLVNTRAVYVDPQAVMKICNPDMDKDDPKIKCLLDEPSMALCPYLDMFNHSVTAKTDADVICERGRYFYQLRTHTYYKKYQQIFISYGSHDNMKLVMEYGFFIPGNYLDCVRFKLEEILDVLSLKLDQRQYKFINKHGFINNLFVTRSVLSFNLKALLFVAKNCDIRNYSQYVYTDLDNNFSLENYIDDLENLLNYKFVVYKNCLKKFGENNTRDRRGELVISYLNYYLKFIQQCLSDYFHR